MHQNETLIRRGDYEWSSGRFPLQGPPRLFVFANLNPSLMLMFL